MTVNGLGDRYEEVILGGVNNTRIQGGARSYEAAKRDEPANVDILYDTFMGKMKTKLTGYMEKFYDSSGVTYQYDEHRELSIDITRIKNRDRWNSNFTSGIEIYSKAINGIYAANQYHEQLENTIANQTRELEYYTTPQNNLIMSEEHVLTQVAEFRPEIVIYVQKYGVPTNLIFDSLKLGAILLAL